ncbi:hypothetical protein MAP00_006563 [Monascus purpureus]|nr:hypothetical protein MAP00_006563 [Monascus purpureus]
MPGAFYYMGPEEVDLAKSRSLKEELLNTVESSGWNCQDWALEGLEKLRADGFIYDGYTRETVKAWLKEK